MKISKYLFALTALAVAASSHAQVDASTGAPASSTVTFSENFDSLTRATTNGWVLTNLSTERGGNWFQGNDGIFAAQSGAANSWVGANYESAVGGEGTIDNWLISPEIAVFGSSQLSFFTRTDDASFNDKIEVRFSAGGSTDIAGFSTVLNTVGGAANFPDGGWQNFVTSLNATSGTGRFAFRYSVADAANANYVGIDSVSVSAVPEPSTYAVMGIGLLVLALRRRKPSAKTA
jgi:hypothetical protein